MKQKRLAFFPSLPPRCPGVMLLAALLVRSQSLEAGSDTMTVMEFSAYDGRPRRAIIEVVDERQGLRRYRHSSSQPLRDDKRQVEWYREYEGQPRLRSGNAGFDGLFALAVSEMLLDSVNEIRDAAYDDGNSIECACFETGEKWNYVWTRDLAYAAHLGLAFLDPQRVRNSLLFKTSSYRDGIEVAATAAGSEDGLQIIQDTGSGGSWPVSTDRVSWAFGADAALRSLPDAERRVFARMALDALSNTIDNDRLAAFDGNRGLYTGEQSFLDWREQSYARWIPGQLSHMSTSSALSTNIGHYQALVLAASLAREFAQLQRADRYDGWARELRHAINRQLWSEEAGLYSSLTAGHFDGAAMPKYDWLGQSLAILSGVADEKQRARILASYPHGPRGAPVIYPQQPDTPIYHNRAIWPFVTAYGLYAAIAGENVSVADSAIETLIRGAALNISNMENLEWLSAAPLFHDPRDASLDGPVVNSRRQLWSVAAYLGMVVHGIFGVQPEPHRLRVRPFVTTALRQRFFADSQSLRLDNLRWQGKRLDFRLQFPPPGEKSGYYSVDRILLDGEPITDGIALDALDNHSQVDVELGVAVPGQQAITRVASDPRVFDEGVYAPAEPGLRAARKDAGNLVSVMDTINRGDLYYRVFRNGSLVADRLSAGDWLDMSSPPGQACYAASAVFKSSGNESHHSKPVCVETGEEIVVSDPRVSSSVAVSRKADVEVIRDWGAPKDTLRLDGLHIREPGNYAVQINYHNALNAINTGITCGVKWLSLHAPDGAIVGEGVVQLPHSPAEPVKPVYSTPLELRLSAGEYRLQLSDFYNMSYFRSNRTYVGNGGAGGKAGPVNQFDIYAIRVLPLWGDR